MATIPHRGIGTEHALFVPDDDVCNPLGDGDDATRALVLLGRAQFGDVLDYPRLAAFGFEAAAARRTSEIEWLSLIAFRSISSAHQYQPVSSECCQALHGVS